MLFVAIATLCGIASGEVTVDSLIGGSVSGVGPFHQDLQDAIKQFAEKDYAGRCAPGKRKKLTPRLPPAEIMMAQMQLDANQVLAAIAMLERAIARRRKNPEAYVILAEAPRMRAGPPKRHFCINARPKRLEAFSDNPKRKQTLQLRTYTGWATVDEGHGNWKDAAAKLEQLVKLDPVNGAAHDRLARVLYRSGNQEAAYAEFKLATDSDKQLPPAEMSMAMLSNDKGKAEKWLKFALEKHPGDLRTQIGAADYLMAPISLPKPRHTPKKP